MDIALCIPTMDRFDTFLKGYLDIYIEFLKSGLISEIIICDENGIDYKKICTTYSEFMSSNTNFRIYWYC